MQESRPLTADGSPLRICFLPGPPRWLRAAYWVAPKRRNIQSPAMMYRHFLTKHCTDSYFPMRPIPFCTQLSHFGCHQLSGGAVADAIPDRIIPGSYKLEIQGTVSMRQQMADAEKKTKAKLRIDD